MKSMDDAVEQYISPTDRVLDIGSGSKQYQNFECKEIIGIDAWEKVNPDILLDLEEENLPFEDNSFDVVLMIDFIEHLTKDRGFEIIEEAKRVATDKVVIFTPLFWVTNEENTNDPELWCYGNKFNIHKSLWELEDFDGWIRCDPMTLEPYLREYYLGHIEVE
jgi:hypothetical protein